VARGSSRLVIADARDDIFEHGIAGRALGPLPDKISEQVRVRQIE
jgi:hypothetical protein